MNVEKARFNMVEQQIRPWEVLDADVQELLYAVKREEFVPTSLCSLAFADAEIPLGHGAFLPSPKLVARALQVLKVRKSDKVLEIGAGSGYMAALLAAHGERVWSIEIVPELAKLARDNLARQHITNVSVEVGNGARGWPGHSPYNVIMVSASLPFLPQELLAQLKVGGRLFAVVGEGPAMTAQLVTRSGDNAYVTEGLFETELTPLREAPQAQRFVF